MTHILLVDDDTELSSMLGEYLTAESFSIDYAYDALQRVTSVVNVIGTTTNEYDQWGMTTIDAEDLELYRTNLTSTVLMIFLLSKLHSLCFSHFFIFSGNWIYFHLWDE